MSWVVLLAETALGRLLEPAAACNTFTSKCSDLRCHIQIASCFPESSSCSASAAQRAVSLGCQRKLSWISFTKQDAMLLLHTLWLVISSWLSSPGVYSACALARVLLQVVTCQQTI